MIREILGYIIAIILFPYGIAWLWGEFVYRTTKNEK